MNKARILFVFSFALPFFMIHAQRIFREEEKPVVRLLEQSEDNLVLRLEVPGFEHRALTYDGRTIQTVTFPTGVTTHVPGAPEIPMSSTIVAVPDRSPVSVEVVETGETHTFSNVAFPPVRESWWEGEEEPPYIEKPAYYRHDGYYPGKYVQIDDPVVFRDFRLVRISWYPVRYNPVSGKAETVSSITIRLQFDGDGEVVNPRTAPVRPIAPAFDRIYRSFIFNYESALQSRNLTDLGEDLMLCIMPDEFYESFQVYADWKKRSGINVVVTKFSDIGANSSNPVTIKNYLSNVYQNWETPPAYVLIVGDKDVFPVKYISYDYTFVYDDYFVELEGNDFFPEMMIGRFTNQGDYRMRVMINKFQLYEETPYMEDTDWFTKGICCSNDAYESQVTTKQFTRNIMLNEGGFSSVDAMMSDSDFGCTYGIDDIIDALNEGRSFLNYRGEGWTTGWWASCYPFGVSDVAYLNNGQKFTFFTSIGCGVAMFDADGGNCFGEALVQKGSLSNPQGAIAFIGPTSNTHTTYNNKIDKGIYKGMFSESMDTPGQALLRGKLYMYNIFGGNDIWVEYHYRIYHVLGDPSIHIWKHTPRYVDVEHPSIVSSSATDVTVQVSYQDDGSPAEGARVTITGENGFFANGITGVNGEVTLSGLAPDGLSEYRVTVTGGDIYPYQGNMEISIGVGGEEITGIEVYPNPSAASQGVHFLVHSPSSAAVQVKIYRINGQLIRTLEAESGPETDIFWDGTGGNGRHLSAGVYFAEIISGDTKQTVKLWLE